MEKRCISAFAAPPFYRHSRKLAASQLKHCSVPVAMLAKPEMQRFSIPHSPAFFLPGFSNFVHIPTLTVFRCRLFFAGTGRNNKTIFYISHTSTIILCDNLHFPFLSTRHMRSRKLFFYNSAFHYEFIS